MAKYNDIEERFFDGNDQLPKGVHTYEWTPEMISDMKRSSEDIVFFAEKFVKIISLDHGEVNPILHDCQKRALNNMIDSRFFILLAPRQTGKTTMFFILALHLACFSSNQRILIVANKGETAKEIFSRARDSYESLPNWIKPGVRAIGREHLELENGSSIKITKTTKSAARGKSINLLIIDEMAFIEPGLMEGFWRSTYPTISSSESARILCSSTPNGTGNLFYERWMDATRNPDTNWKYERIKWDEIPGRDDAWVKRTISEIGSQERFNQEFGCEFLDYSSSGIDEKTAKFIESTLKDPIITLKDGFYRVWEAPNDDHIYIVGVDVAEGVGKNQSVVEVFDVTDCSDVIQVAEFASTLTPVYDFVKQVYDILIEWGSPMAAIEKNSIGAEVVSRLINDYGYNNLIALNSKGECDQTNPGIYSHTNTKATAINNLRFWLHDKHKLKIRSSELFDELRTFVRKPKGTWGAKDGYCQDDRVMATIWAIMTLHNNVCENYYTIKKRDEYKRPLIILPNFRMGEIKKGEYVNGKSPDLLIPTYCGNFAGAGSLNNEINRLRSEGFGIEPEPIYPKYNKFGMDISYIFGSN